MARARTAGWHPHPTKKGALGYWDGQEWTDDIASVHPAGGPSLGTLITAILLSLLVVAFVVGVIVSG